MLSQDLIMIGCLFLLWVLQNSNAAPYTFPSANLKVSSPTLSLFNAVPTTTEEQEMQQNSTESRVNEQTLKSYLNFLADDQNNQKIDEPQEITLYRPKFTKNAKGKWVAVYTIPWVNTRYNQGPVTIPRMLVEKNVDTHYYPNQNDGLSTVCDHKSTAYNQIPGIWLNKAIHAVVLQERVFHNALRRGIYKYGRTEECHTPKFNKPINYLNCALKRNMRADYYMPYYPIYQRGSLSNYKIYFVM